MFLVKFYFLFWKFWIYASIVLVRAVWFNAPTQARTRWPTLVWPGSKWPAHVPPPPPPPSAALRTARRLSAYTWNCIHQLIPSFQSDYWPVVLKPGLNKLKLNVKRGTKPCDPLLFSISHCSDRVQATQSLAKCHNYDDWINLTRIHMKSNHKQNVWCDLIVFAFYKCYFRRIFWVSGIPSIGKFNKTHRTGLKAYPGTAEINFAGIPRLFLRCAILYSGHASTLDLFITRRCR